MKYNIIYADPPWQYNSKRHEYIKNNSGNATKHYKTMNFSQIKDFNIKELADKDCILFLWVTFPNLQEGLDIIKEWGFNYKTIGFSWFKTDKNINPSFGVGYYTRSNCEICLLATKGHPKIINKGISSVVISPREEHSKKPDIVRDKIVELCGDIPRIELFARQRVKGWDAQGDEI